ncbi:MAG: hypothetical protein HC843_02680 [Sphingomonadales bacterium]|nr:hypothetical protein [Sphingomonadales bacterium]
MSFPHLNEFTVTPSARPDFRALISKAISRQGTSPTALLMLANSRESIARPTVFGDGMTQRIRYFAAKLQPQDAAIGPYGAFFHRIFRNIRIRPIMTKAFTKTV